VNGFPSLQNIYHPELWHEAYIVLGGGAAALAGLFMVAVSVRVDQIMSTPRWRIRARNSTISMIGIMVASILVLLPQDPFALGVELIVLNLGCAISLPGRLVFYLLINRIHGSFHLPMLAVLFYLLAAAGGASLIVGWGGGMYLITAAYMMFLLFSPYNAYLLLLPHDQPSEARKRARR
jgi:hypothetical protein